MCFNQLDFSPPHLFIFFQACDSQSFSTCGAAARGHRLQCAGTCVTLWQPHLQEHQTSSNTGITSSVQLRIWPLLCLLLDGMDENIFIFCLTFWWPCSFFFSFHFSYPIQNFCCRNSMSLLLSFTWILIAQPTRFRHGLYALPLAICNHCHCETQS